MSTTRNGKPTLHSFPHRGCFSRSAIVEGIIANMKAPSTNIQVTISAQCSYIQPATFRTIDMTQISPLSQRGDLRHVNCAERCWLDIRALGGYRDLDISAWSFHICDYPFYDCRS